MLARGRIRCSLWASSASSVASSAEVLDHALGRQVAVGDRVDEHADTVDVLDECDARTRDPSHVGIGVLQQRGERRDVRRQLQPREQQDGAAAAHWRPRGQGGVQARDQTSVARSALKIPLMFQRESGPLGVEHGDEIQLRPRSACAGQSVLQRRATGL